MTVFACAAWIAASGSPAFAQEPPVAGMKTIQLPLLLDLPGDLAFVRYTPGSLDRSASVQMRFELMAKEFQRSGFLQATLVFYVLSRDDWKEAGLPDPYGAPLVLGNDAIAMAGWADEQVVNGWRTLLGGELPMLLRNLAPVSARMGMPFSFTAFISSYAGQALLVLIPIAALIIPITRTVPPLYVWMVRRKLFYWYNQLKALEKDLDSRGAKLETAAHQAELERIDGAVRRIRVPLYFSNELYDLRLHIDLVRQRLAMPPGVPMAAE